MADYEHFNGDEDNADIRKLTAELQIDPDNFDAWQKLVEAAAGLEGGLNRNSSPQALGLYRDSYDRFLQHFPLVFGYWKKYATLEFSIAGPEAAVLVYERGCASITNSVDLWTDYCRFKMETTHDPKLVREAATFVGLDFLAHEFWDRYIEFENRQEAPDRVFAILSRVIHIPMHQYARYYQSFRELMLTRPLNELAPPETLARFRSEVESDTAYPGVQRPELEIEREIRTKIDGMYYEIFTRTQTETSKRWTFESEITRPYFHVGELEHSQLNNWRKYLDFEESEGEHARIVALYERCLVTCAFYDEFWFRYARWMLAQTGKEEEVRHIYQRASTVFVPISRPGIRLQWAHFEEAHGCLDVAKDIHSSIMMTLPNCTEAVISLAHLNRRHEGLDAAIAVFKEQINSPAVDILTKAVLVAQWALLLWKVKGSVDEARQVFETNVEWYADSLKFWTKWLEFELDQPTNSEVEAEHSSRLKAIFEKLRTKSRLSTTVKKSLSQIYLTYLQERGGKDAMMQFLVIDRDMFGPPSISTLSQAKLGSKDGGPMHLGDLDAATRAKAESHYPAYYQQHADPAPNATGPAPFQ